MVVDENLNDCSKEYIDRIRNAYKIKSRRLTITCILLLINSGALIFATSRSKNLVNDNKNLNIQLEQEESMLSLEYSIGYWFINTPEPVNDSLLYTFIVQNGAWYPDILLRQAKIESGNYTSDIYTNTCNLYGMRMVGKRQTTQRDIYKGYGVYDNWCLSALDRILWDLFIFNNKKPTVEEYMNAMNIYSENINYKNKLL